MANHQLPTKRINNPCQRTAKILAQLNLGYEIDGGDVSALPKKGPVLVVANCPFGGVESIVLLHLLLKYRDDVKILGTRQLKEVCELSGDVIAVRTTDLKQVDGLKKTTRKNIHPMHQAVRWLTNGGLLITFPAGGARALNLAKLQVGEGKWHAYISRLVRMTSASVIPLHIKPPGTITYRLLSKIYPRLNKAKAHTIAAHNRDRQLHLWIGEPIAASRLKRLGNDDEIARYLRLHTHMLASTQKTDKTSQPLPTATPPQPDTQHEAIIEAVPSSLILSEINQFRPEQKLVASSDMDVYLAKADQIPETLREIGRLREITFRAAGEGTGKAIDIDLHDMFYLHLFLWDRKKQQIAGAYRLGLTDEIIAQHGKNGLYSQTLFKLHSRFLENLPPAIELGRSFVCGPYQKSLTPLLLLWKGIGAFIVGNPQYSTLFGPVSISNDYCSTSRQLLIDFLKISSFDDPLRKLIKARHPYRGKLRPAWRKRDLAGIGSFDGLSDLISLIEDDGKGAPVLMRHYVNIGGRMLGFNVDKDFGNCVDGLVVVDLCETSDRILNRYLGPGGVERFRQFHNRALALAS